jgi:hypothetical protein
LIIQIDKQLLVQRKKTRIPFVTHDPSWKNCFSKGPLIMLVDYSHTSLQFIMSTWTCFFMTIMLLILKLAIRFF